MTDMNENEVFPIVDSNGCVTGKATRRECHCGSMLLHPVVHMHIIDHEGNIFLQRRSDNKDIQPGRWDTAVGGHIDFGESVGEALKRETKEELGIVADNFFHLVTYEFKSERERELINAYCMVVDPETFSPKVDKTEISEARFWTIGEIESVKGKGILTPNFESEFEMVKDMIYELL